MDIFLLVTVAGFSTIPAAVIGCIKYKSLAIANRWFVSLCVFALFVESISQWIITVNKWSNAFIANIYVLVEVLLYLIIFYYWNVFKKNKKPYALLAVIVVITWTIDNFYLHKIDQFNSLCRVVNWTVIFFLSIEKIGSLKFQVRGSLLKDSTFIICSGLIIFGVYKAIFEFFVLIKLNISNNLFFHLYEVLQYVNIFSNTLFALAILWMPKKHNFTMPFS